MRLRPLPKAAMDPDQVPFPTRLHPPHQQDRHQNTMSAALTPPNENDDKHDHVVDAYSLLYPPNGKSPADFPLAAIEAHQVYLAVTGPAIDVRGKRVLDLDCGNGHDASNLLSRGAASVTGLDDTPEMLDMARQSVRARGIDESRLNFLQGDAMDEDLAVPGAPFDIITRYWLLNYAPDAATMTKLFKSIARNLRPGGYWVGLVLPPLLSDKPYEAKVYTLDAVCMPGGAWARHGQTGQIIMAIPSGDGYQVSVESGTDAHKGKAVIQCYWLSLKVFEQACKDSGVFEDLEMRDFAIPKHVKDAYLTGYWNDLALRPSCTVVNARKLS